jgi:hypothetical protein
VAALAVAFLFFPQHVSRLLAPNAAEFTAGMHRTFVRVEGMTCPG